jgi:hypothetical protein
MKDLHACLSRAVLCAAVVNVAPAPSVSAQAGSRVYQPTKGPEAAAADHADRHVYPADVRDQPQLHAKDMVVWAGILKAHGVKEADAAATLVMTVEHRYYDWIEDFSQAPERYFLSPRGEGTFQASWSMPLAQSQRMSRDIHDGDMVIAYGHPVAAAEGRVADMNPTEYVRIIRRRLYTDEALSYGRAKK